MLNPRVLLSDAAKETIRRVLEGAAIGACTALAYWGVEEAKAYTARRRESRAAQKAKEEADRQPEKDTATEATE
jgi:hypothetical protein